MKDEEGTRRLRYAGEAALLLALLALGAFLLFYPKRAAALRFDSAAYAAQAINIADGKGNTISLGGREIQGFYPPGYPAIIALFNGLLGNDLQNGVVTCYVLGILTLLGAYFLGRAVSGPMAGATAGLLLLSSDIFRHVAAQIYSQMPSLFFVVVMTGFVLYGWRPGRPALACRFIAGFLSGVIVLIRSNNVILAPALAVFALFATPPKDMKRISTALPLWLGIGSAVGITVAYNLVNFGSPFATGYTSWGFELKEVFSLDYIFHPPRIQMDEAPYQLVRSVFGFGILYTWPVAALAMLGAVGAWLRRKTDPQLWRLTQLTLIATCALYAFLACYFFRSPLYSLLTVPLIVVLASAGIALIFRFAGGKLSLHSKLYSWIPPVLAFTYLLPFMGQAALMGEWREFKTPVDITAFEAADELFEEDAVLIGASNPVVAEYVFVRESERRFLCIAPYVGPMLEEIVYPELGTKEITIQSIAQYARERMAEGKPVYFMKLLPVKPGKGQFLVNTYKYMKKNFRLVDTPIGAVQRVQIKPLKKANSGQREKSGR